MHDALGALLRTSLLIIGALFPIVDSPENIPIFLSLTRGLSSASRSALARKIAVNSFFLLIVSVLIGTHILAFFGISLPVVQVGGGSVVFAFGWKLLSRSDDDDKGPELSSKPPKASYLSSRAFYPLTLPLTVGPGSISVAIAVGANRTPGNESQWIVPVAAVLGCIVMAVTVYLMYRFAEPIGAFLGETAMNVIIRLSAFILLCIGVQILWNGTSALLSAMLAGHR